ncbi:alpha1 6 fucosyltransferase [Sarcoptes scabiei]|nr:alpha1 6 fucosyltransferase [Sarcoptes scabiei]
MLETIYSFLNGFIRNECYPTLYDRIDSNLWIDLTLFRLLAIFFAAFISLMIILPGFRSNKKIYVFIRWTTSLIILFLILFCNFMPYWEHGAIRTRMPYKFGRPKQINATLAIKIGLRGFNVTLVGDPIRQDSNEINHNEYFDWTWSQGKPVYNFNDGHLQKDYRKAQLRCLPYSILWIAETFTIDQEQIRIGRYYRQAGWLAHIFLWTAVPLFILANVLFQTVIYYGSLFIIFTGLSLLSANLIIISLRSTIPFSLAFEDESLRTNYSYCFYLNLINGLVCVSIGFMTLIADLRWPDEIAEFFGNDVLQSYEDYFADDGEVLLRKKPTNQEQTVNYRKITSGLRKRTLNDGFSTFQKSNLRKMIQSIRIDEEEIDENGDEDGERNPSSTIEMPVYENLERLKPKP